MNDFKFAIGAPVRIDVSSEEGTVIGRAQYLACENSYLVRYAGADRSAREAWWQESALVAAD